MDSYTNNRTDGLLILYGLIKMMTVSEKPLDETEKEQIDNDTLRYLRSLPVQWQNYILSQVKKNTGLQAYDTYDLHTHYVQTD